MQEDNEFFKQLQEQAKDALQKKGEHPPVFMFESDMDGKKGIALMPAPMADDGQKAEFARVLPEIVEKLNCERYYAVFDAFMASPQDAEKKMKKIVQEMQQGTKDARIAAQEIVELRKRPSENPVRREVLVVMQCTRKGTDIELFPYVRENEKIVFKPLPETEKKKVSSEDAKSSYNRWNVWKNFEIDLGEE